MPSCAFGCCCGILGGGERSCFSLQVLIKKSYDRSRRQRRRNWKLKELERDREAPDTDDERFSICSPCSVPKLLQLLNNLQLRGKREEMRGGWVGRIKQQQEWVGNVGVLSGLVLVLGFYFVAWISINPREKWVNPSHISYRQYQDFLEDLEEDETIRKNVNIYRSKAFKILH